MKAAKGLTMGVVRSASRKRALMYGVVLALVLTPVAQASAETLAEAMALAYDGNPSLRAARAQLRATDESVAIAASGWRPTVTVNGSILRQEQESQNPTSASVGGGTGAALGLGIINRTAKQMQAQASQPLFRGFGTSAQTSLANNEVRAQRARLEQTEGNVLLQTATAYFDILETEAVLDLQRSNVQVLERNLEATSDRFRVGELTRTDVAQSEAQLQGARASLVQAEGEVQRARAAYENVVGQPAGTLIKPDLPSNLPRTLEEAVRVAIHDNAAYIAADYTARARKNNIDVQRASLLPSASLVATFTRSWDANLTGSRSQLLSGGAQVTVPLYQAGAEWARLRQARDTYGQFLLQSDQARLDARQAATTAYELLSSLLASQDSLRSQIEANKISLEGVRREAEVGSRTVLDVLEEEQRLLNSQVNLVRNQHDQLVAAFQVLQAMGKLTAGDLGLGVKLYDPTHHYDAVRGQWLGMNSDTAADVAGRKP